MREKRFALSLGLPEDSTGDCARVTLVGQSAALVEGQHGVIELTESRVRLRTGRGVLTVLGEGLRLRELSVDAALIRRSRADGDLRRGRANAMNLTLELSGLNLERLLRTAGETAAFGCKMSAGWTSAPCASSFRPRRRKEAGRALRTIRLADDGGSAQDWLASAASRTMKRRWTLGASDAAQRLLGLSVSSEMIWRVEIDGRGGKYCGGAPLSGRGRTRASGG